MADEAKVSLIELDIKSEDVTKKLADLTAQMAALKDTTGLTSEEIENNKAQQKALGEEYRNNQKVLVNLTKSGKDELGTLQKLALSNKTLRAEQQGLNLETKEGVKRNQEINKEINKNTAIIRENSDAFVQDKINVGNYKSALDGLLSPLNSLPGSLGNVSKGVKGLSFAAKAFIAIPIVLVITLLAKAFSNSQKAVDIFKQGLSAVSAVINVLIDRVSNFVEGALSIFNKELRESRKAAKDLNDELIGINDTMTEREKRQLRRQSKPGLFEEMKKEAAQAAQLQKDINSLDDAEIAYSKTKAEINRQIAEKRLLSKDENLNDRQRLSALDEAIKLEKELSDKEVAFAKERARISQEQVDMGNSTRDELKENADLQAAAIEAETAGLMAQRQIASERLGLINKISAAEKKALDEKEAALKKELDAIKKFNDDINSEQEKAFKKKIDSFTAELDAEIAAQVEANERADAYELNRQIENAALKRDIQESAIESEFELRQVQLDNDRLAEIAIAEKTGADILLINQKYANYQKVLDREVNDAKLQVASEFTGSIAQLFGEQSKVGKMAAIASTTIDTYRAAQAAFASLAGIPVVGPVLGGAAAAAAVVSGLANVKKIIKTKSGLPGDSGGSMPSISSASTISTPPAQMSFAGNDVLRTRGQSNNIEQSMINALKAVPMQPVLVTDQVTAKQKSFNRTIETATV